MTKTRATRLFTIRLWREETEGRAEWRGKVQALPDGEAYYFRGWSGLIERLEAMLAVGNAETTNIDLAEGVNMPGGAPR